MKNFIQVLPIPVSAPSNSNQARSAIFRLGNFNSGVSTMKHLKGITGADSVKKNGLVLVALTVDSTNLVIEWKVF